MEGMFFEMDRGGVSDTWKKTVNVRFINTLICLAFVQANQSFLFTF